MQKHKLTLGLFAPKIAAVVIAAAAIFFTSCKSLVNTEKIDGVNVLNPDADLYAYIPVPENKELVNFFVNLFLESPQKDSEKIINRLDEVYFSSENFPLSLTSKFNCELVAKGKFPPKTANMFLSSKKEWNVKKYHSYKYLENTKNWLEMAFTDDFVFVSDDVKNQLTHFDDAIYGEFLKKDSEKIKIVKKFFSDCKANQLKIISFTPETILEQYLGTKIPFGIKTIFITATQRQNKSSHAEIVLELNDPRTARACSALLSIAMIGSDAIVSQNEYSQIVINNINFKWTQFLNLKK